MRKCDFYAALHTLTGCSPEAARKWIDFAAECVQEEQYVLFASTHNAEADVEQWLDALCAGFYQVRERLGPEAARKTVDLSLDMLCLYPYEMMQAADCLRQGETAKQIGEKIKSGEIDGEPPFFYTVLHPLSGRDCGPEVAVTQTGVSIGWPNPRMEPGYVLRDGTALLESERDPTGCYIGGAGTDGMYLRTGRIYRPVYSDDGQLRAFCPVRAAPENYLATAEMTLEGNYNQIDGIINNEPPKPSLLDTLRQYKEETGRQGQEPASGPNAQER